MNSQVGVKTAARLLGVSPSTLKRLCDICVIPSVRTPGGHRRFDRSSIARAGRQIVGESSQPLNWRLQQQWNALLRKGAQSEFIGALDEFSNSGGMISQLDSVLQLSREVLDELVKKHGAHDYRIHLACQSALSAITWQTRQFRLNTSKCKRAIGCALNFDEVSQPVDQIASALVGLALGVLNVDALNVSEPSNITTLLDASKRMGVSYVWLVYGGNRIDDSIEQTLNALSNGVRDDVRVMFLAPELDLGPSVLERYAHCSNIIADLTRVVSQDFADLVNHDSTTSSDGPRWMPRL